MFLNKLKNHQYNNHEYEKKDYDTIRATLYFVLLNDII